MWIEDDKSKVRYALQLLNEVRGQFEVDRVIALLEPVVAALPVAEDAHARREAMQAKMRDRRKAELRERLASPHLSSPDLIRRYKAELWELADEREREEMRQQEAAARTDRERRTVADVARSSR